MATLNRSILQAALEGLEEQRKRLDEHIASVRSMLGKRGPGRPQASAVSTETPQPRTRRPLSAAARKRIATAQKKRWAAVRKAARKAANGDIPF